jgi:pyruvate,water dikinase
VPEGFWELESSQNPEPISPMAASFFLEALTAGTRHLFAEIGMLAEAAEWKAIGGWVYLRSIPFTGDEQAMAARLERCREAVEDDLAGRYLQRWDEQWRPWLDRRAEDLGQVDLGTLDERGLAEHLAEVIEFVFAATDVHMLLHGSNALMLGELAFACRDLLDWDEPQVFELLCGTSSASTEPARRLAQLAELARDRPAVLDLLDDPADAVARLAGTDPRFAAAFAAYLDEFGGRAIRYEVIDPTFGERPDLLLRLVRDQLRRGYDQATVHARAAERQAKARAGARASLAERHPEARGRFERLLRRAERFYPIREDNEVRTTNVPLGLTRRALLEVGRRLAAAGMIDQRDDVFLLRREEAERALLERADLRALTCARWAERAWAQAHPGPASYGSAPPEPDLSGLPAAARFVHEATAWLIDRVLAPTAAGHRQAGPIIEGIPAAPGRYTGPARVVLGENEFDKLRPGDVLVCPVTSPAWSPVFPTVAALVTDTGGILSHQAIIAREFGIPAVVATGNATELLLDDQLVTVDGDQGRVEITT